MYSVQLGSSIILHPLCAFVLFYNSPSSMCFCVFL